MKLQISLKKITFPLIFSAILMGCVSNPPAPQGSTTLEQASQRLSDDLLGQIHANVLERLISRKVVIDPFIDAQSGQRTKSSMQATEWVQQQLQARNSTLKIEAFDASGVQQADYLIAGTISKPHPSSSDFVINATVTDRRSGTVLASAVSRVQGSEIDSTPSAFYSDSPSLVTDRLTKGYITTSQTPQGSAADQAYLASISTAALVNEAITAYEERRWEDALIRYQTVVQRNDGKQLRVFNGLYNSYLKLGKTREAEEAFEDIVTLGLSTNNLAVRLLFQPGSTDFWRDSAISGIYPMWLRKIAAVTYAGDYCITVVGHTSKTGSETVNERLSLARAHTVQDLLVAQQRKLSGRVDTAGVGWKENIIGTGTDDIRDSLDRRVEFKIRSCKQAT